MKKEYTAPTMETIQLQVRKNLMQMLVSSAEVESGLAPELDIYLED